VVLLDADDDYEVDMNQEAGEASPVNPNGNEEALVGQNVPSPQVPGSQARQVPQRPAAYPHQQLPMTPSYHMVYGRIFVERYKWISTLKYCFFFLCPLLL